MKYIVMECRNDYAILLDEEAGFFKAVNENYEIGETIENPTIIEDTEDVKKQKKPITISPQFVKAASILTAIAACLLLIIGVNYYQGHIAIYSSITMSINPDVQMKINRHGQVLSVEGLNTDGIDLIAEYKPDKKDKNIVSGELIDLAVEKGYLKSGGTITFTIDVPDNWVYKQYNSELLSEVTKHTTSLSDIVVEIKHSSTESPSTTNSFENETRYDDDDDVDDDDDDDDDVDDDDDDDDDDIDDDDDDIDDVDDDINDVDDDDIDDNKT